MQDLSDGCGGKFDAVIVTKKFEGKPLLARHRMVNAVLVSFLLLLMFMSNLFVSSLLLSLCAFAFSSLFLFYTVSVWRPDLSRFQTASTSPVCGHSGFQTVSENAYNIYKRWRLCDAKLCTFWTLFYAPIKESLSFLVCNNKFKSPSSLSCLVRNNKFKLVRGVHNDVTKIRMTSNPPPPLSLWKYVMFYFGLHTQCYISVTPCPQLRDVI